MQRLMKMVALRKSGATYQEIGKAYGISRQRVWFLLNRYYEATGKKVNNERNG